MAKNQDHLDRDGHPSYDLANRELTGHAGQPADTVFDASGMNSSRGYHVQYKGDPKPVPVPVPVPELVPPPNEPITVVSDPVTVEAEVPPVSTTESTPDLAPPSADLTGSTEPATP